MEAELREKFERELAGSVPGRGERPAELHEAMLWALEGGGKRIRPRVCMAAAAAAVKGGAAEDALPAAAAIELLHTYTLVHDDLPAMDNDTERRGRASVWAKFGEATAILAADALQAAAFARAAGAPRNVAAVVAELARAGVGVVQGQVEDIDFAEKRGEGMGNAELGAKVEFIYRHKTADLFEAAAVMGALSAGADAAAAAKLREYGLNLGLAFQYEDDLLDGDSPWGREETERRVEESTAAAVKALEGLPGDAGFLRELALGLVGRKK